MMRSLFSGVSGLKNHQTRMDVIGNNISNVNTTGFKSSRVNFEDSLSQTLTAASSASGTVGGTNPKQIGLGSRISAIDVNFKDGSVQSTGINTDLCLSGNALFVVKQGEQTFYTRNGAFNFDAEGNLVNAEGLYVQGYMNESTTVHNTVNTNGSTTNIAVRAGKTMPSSATDVVNYVNNLNSSSAGITNITYTYADGTSGSANVKGQEVDLSPKANSTGSEDVTITIELADGQTFTKVYPPSLTPTYTTGDTYTTPIKYKVNTVTSSTAGDVKLSLDVPYNIEPSGTTIDVDATVGSSNMIGDLYTHQATIKSGGVTANSDGTVTLSFVTDSGQPIQSVTVPEPQNGKYQDGDIFYFKKCNVTGITAKTGAKLNLEGYALNGGVYTLGATETATLSSTSTVFPVPAKTTGVPTDFTINSAQSVSNGDVTFTVNTEAYNGIQPSSISFASTAGNTYTVGGSYAHQAEIATVTDNADGTQTLTFTTSATQPVTSVIVQGGTTYTPGTDYVFNFEITGISNASAGAVLTLQGYNYPPTYTNPYTVQSTDEVTDNSIKGISYANTIKSIARASESGTKIVSAVLTLSDGTTQTVTSGNYIVGDSIPLSTTVNVYDSLGTKHVVPITLEKSYKDDNLWVAKLASSTIQEADGTETKLDMPDVEVPFTSSGAYSALGSPGVLNLTYGNGAADQQVTVNFSNLTQYANSSTVNAEGNGYASGTLETVTIDESGTVVGTYTNGVLRKEAQIAVAQFTNAPGLTKKGNSLYVESNNSGTPNIGTAEGFGATITASALEMSNVDVAEEFSNMIITQRGFQSNSKIITVSDEMLENLINMKR